jgi:hypothetical protein
MVDGIQVQKVGAVSESKCGNVWIYNTVYTGYTWSLLSTPSALTALGAHSPVHVHQLDEGPL